MRPLAVSLSLSLSLGAGVALAQLPCSKQPDHQRMRAALEEARAKRPRNPKPLLAMKQGSVDPSLAADLQKFDWYLAGMWSSADKRFAAAWPDEVLDYDLTRYRPDGGELRFRFTVSEFDASRMVLESFSSSSEPTSFVDVRKVGPQTYWDVSTMRGDQRHRVVSYKNGVLVLDVRYDLGLLLEGTPNSKLVTFREVRIALPRLFESTGG